MKPMYSCLLGAAIIFCSCGNNQHQSPAGQEPKVTHTATEEVPAGTVIAADSMPVTEDKLNHFTFSVKILSTGKTGKGHYQAEAAWGHNIATGEFVMPRNDYPLIPVLKRSSEPYTYIIGFYIKGDTTFYDYYKINGTRQTIGMNYTKGYRFQ